MVLLGENIYIAFQFTARDVPVPERYNIPRADASDSLRTMTIFRQLAGCL
jgi:hypothetical protein